MITVKNIKVKCMALIGYLMISIAKFGGKCLLNYTIYKFNKGGTKMANTFWSSIGQIGIAVLASYGSAKVSNEQVSWVPYRTELLNSLTQVALATAVNQATAAIQTQQQPQQAVGQTTQAPSTEATAQ